MGLDNGIIVKRTERTNALGLDDFYTVEYKNSPNLEIFYWRKCWGMRNEVVDYLCDVYGTDRDCYNWYLDVEDIKKIIKIIKNWQNEKRWNAESGSIWSYKEIKDRLRGNIVDLTYLLAKMEAYPDDFKVEFYDSY